MSNQRSRFNTEDWWAVCLGLLVFVLSRLICRAGHHRMGCERENLDRAINVHWRRFFSLQPKAHPTSFIAGCNQASDIL